MSGQEVDAALVAFLRARYAEEWAAARDRELAQGLDESPATRDVDAKRRILLEYSIPDGVDAVYAGTERETGFRLAMSFVVKALGSGSVWPDGPMITVGCLSGQAWASHHKIREWAGSSGMSQWP
jgi:hypothetical protein